ncbi:MAG: hypothetical protein D4R82_04735 [Dehalococcoidia bacterium]|nr:MAG: hypothetical protein D4R82_04735 [Dehalococcoidia bacterium]
MRKAESATSLSILLVLALLLSLLPPGGIKPALAHPGKLIWSIVDTPSGGGNVIVNPSEINALAIGSDGNTFYAVDIPGDLGAPYSNGKVYKSTDGGVTWNDDLTAHLIDDGAKLPAWNIAVAPDDVNFVVAVTDGDGAPNGPKQVFVSTNGGDRWDDTGFPAFSAGEYISCVDVSLEYSDGKRDIAIGTRDGNGTGAVYVLKAGITAPSWKDQGLAGGIVALKFSPTYNGDLAIVAISATAAGTSLNLGIRDIVANTTTWNSPVNYPVTIVDTNYAGSSANCTQIITADLELPSDFSAADPGNLRRYYVSTDVDPAAAAQFGVYRINDTEVYRITPPTTGKISATGRISSLAYYGTYDDGKLLAGEVEADNFLGIVDVWRCSDPIADTPSWQKSDALKSPTGGGDSGYANAQVAWSPDGSRAYCATSSANPIAGGTGPWAMTTNWPHAWLNSVALDESAFSISPYPPSYEDLLDRAGKTKDTDVGNIWNQLSLIDTEISFLSDVAVLEVSEDSEDNSVLYLASISDNTTVTQNFDSIWRSTSGPLGEIWERILCTATTNDGVAPDDGTILRVKPRTYEEADISEVIVFADRLSNDVRYSPDEGQSWQVLSPGVDVAVTDLALASDDVMYILDDAYVRRGSKSGTNWTWQAKIDTYLDSGHTIATPLKNPEGEDEEEEDWVIVGDERGKIAYADFSQAVVHFEPPAMERVAVPVIGNVHVIADDKFEENRIIYAASDDPIGRIYRWRIGESTDWEELEPPNSAFYGLAQRNDVLYGVWNTAATPPPPGVDRTIYPRATVPPATNLEWDDLIEGLSIGVAFTREPSSLKISTNADNTLWAIDDKPYDWANEEGRLWAYADNLAKVGPWTTSPPSDDIIPIDPVSGRANEVNFKWRQLSYVGAYELQLAKDDEFSLRVLCSDNITPADSLAPACYFPAGGLVPTPASEIASWGNLECGHTYYWRVRGRRATTGEEIRSPWSATMYFTVKTGLPVVTEHLGPILLKPSNGARCVSPPPAFSWSPVFGSTRYEFVLAKDAALTHVIARAIVSATAYEYGGKLDWNTAYFWQVRAVEPILGEPSPVANFTVVAREVLAVHSAPSPPSPPPFWIWAAIAIYVALVVAIIGLIRARPVDEEAEVSTINKLSLIIGRPRNILGNVGCALISKIKGTEHPGR